MFVTPNSGSVKFFIARNFASRVFVFVDQTTGNTNNIYNQLDATVTVY